MSIHVSIQHLLSAGGREFKLDMHFSSEARRIALFGPSGAGKTLTLKAIAGLLRPDAGRVTVGERVLFDSAQDIFLKPQQRRLAYLFQEYALFPHLTVGQNIGFGLSTGLFNTRRTSVLPEEAMYWVTTFELAPLLGNYPHQLSGGQRQRVALARALATKPDILLLDEPFSALQASLRRKLREELAELQSRLTVPTVLITHDPQDVRLLADTVFELEDGRVIAQQVGPTFSPEHPA
ncbi:MAG: ATP-binding cassette domain-containing protein [Pigmentiphaga sp.]|nr:ATP-binding cassette domain-containing protein [Pigmentiphaga sp.]